MTKREAQSPVFCSCERAVLCTTQFVSGDLTLYRRLSQVHYDGLDV